LRSADPDSAGAAAARGGTTDHRVVIVAEHASAKFGGEAALPVHYYRVLRQRGVAAWLVVHARTRLELEALFPGDRDRIIFVPDTVWHRLLWRLSEMLPTRLSGFTTGFAMRFITQLYQRREIRKLVRDKGITVIHQPMPVSPKEPSMIYGMGVPVVIGPMNGGMDYPPAFRRMQGWVERLAISAGRKLSALMNKAMPGKRRAAVLLVANIRTRDALPQGVTHRVEMLVENGVDLSLWQAAATAARSPSSLATRYVFLGRLVDWKAVDLLLLAFKRAASQACISLSIIGDGDERPRLEQLAREMDLLDVEHGDQAGKVQFLGWMPQEECAVQLRQADALVLPSLMECGGAVVLEAMAMEIPVIATDWGGPADYLDSSCGILVKPSSREDFVEALAAALQRLAQSPQQRITMGKAGRAKVVRQFDWEVKVDRMLEIYDNANSRQKP
jgi:glycosyltransferase involved in cell wall biosynthesis